MQKQDPNNSLFNVTEEEFKTLKDDIRWDIAWKIFDQVNKGLNTDSEIDLNCLDIEEAQAITKQKIFDLANIA